jgi:hypothetical protein
MSEPSTWTLLERRPRAPGTNEVARVNTDHDVPRSQPHPYPSSRGEREGAGWGGGEDASRKRGQRASSLSRLIGTSVVDVAALLPAFASRCRRRKSEYWRSDSRVWSGTVTVTAGSIPVGGSPTPKTSEVCAQIAVTCGLDDSSTRCPARRAGAVTQPRSLTPSAPDNMSRPGDPSSAQR